MSGCSILTELFCFRQHCFTFWVGSLSVNVERTLPILSLFHLTTRIADETITTSHDSLFFSNFTVSSSYVRFVNYGRPYHSYISGFCQSSVCWKSKQNKVNKVNKIRIFLRKISNNRRSERCTNAELKINPYVCVHIKIVAWKLCFLDPKISPVSNP